MKKQYEKPEILISKFSFEGILANQMDPSNPEGEISVGGSGEISGDDFDF